MTLERKIASKSRQLVQGQDEAYKSDCERLPILLRSAGLAQTAVYLQSKEREIYNHLESQLQDLGLIEGGLIENCTNAGLTLAEYRVLSEVAMMVAVWHKRMAQALIEKEPNK